MTKYNYPMVLIDKRLLVDECLEIIHQIHKAAPPERIKEQDIEYIQKLNTYVQLMKKDLSELDKIYKQLGTELENIKKSGSI